MHKTYLITAFLFAATAVALGAFGAHGLKAYADASTLNVFETAVRYQFYHAIAIALSAILYASGRQKNTLRAALFFTLGIVFFSGSLYLLTVLKINGAEGFKWLGAITPLGGLFYIIGWLLLAVSVYRNTV